MLKSLAKKATYLVQQLLIQHATDIQGSAEHHACPPLEASFIGEYFALVVEAYNHGSLTLTPLRKALVRFIGFTRFFVMRHNTFSERVYGIPEFSRDVLKATFQTQSKDRIFIINNTPHWCETCRKSIDFTPLTWVSNNKGLAPLRYTLRGCCKACAGLDEHADECKDFLGLN